MKYFNLLILITIFIRFLSFFKFIFRDTCHRLTRLLNYLSKKSFVVAELSANLYEKRRQNILNKFQNEEVNNFNVLFVILDSRINLQ